MGVSKVIINGVTRVDLTDDTVTANSLLSGYTATASDGDEVSGSIATKTSSDLTASGSTVTVPAGYYSSNASKSVTSGTAGTPTATKGAVSNHSVSVTPSVTNTTGYITGGTKTGTAVTVSASELVSGTLSISNNGTGIDVTNYAAVDVNAAPTHTFTIGTMTGGRVVYKGTNYMTSNTSFSFAAGDTATLYAQQGDHNKIVIDGVEILSGFGTAYYTITLPDHDVIAECAFDSSAFTATMYVTYPTITITTNGKSDVSDYYYADVNVDSKSYIATISWSSSTHSRTNVKYNNSYYRSDGATFTFHAGETAELEAYGEVGGGSVYVDDVWVASTDHNQPYTYTLPASNIDLVLSTNGGGSIHVNTVDTIDITSNGTHNVEYYTYADVAVPTGTARTSSDLTVSGATVTVPAGLYSMSATKTVASGTAGTPTASKGSVSNHSVSVTPSVTNTTGYITGSTKTGTPVTVSASELVSGTKTITSNGTGIDVTNYARVDVNAAPTHTCTIISNTSASNCRVLCNGNQYSFNGGTSFTFHTGDEIEIEAGDSNNQSGRVFVDGVKVADGDMDPVRYSYTAPDHDIEIAATIINYGEGRVDITFPTVSINANGRHDVSDYYYADVSGIQQYTCTITHSASTSVGNSIEYNGTSYYNVNDTFVFSPGDSATLKTHGYISTRDIIVDGVIVSPGGMQSNSYTYTLPAHDIEIKITGNSSLPNGGTLEVIFPVLSIAANNKYDMTGYVYADVSVPASAVVSGTKQIVSNATQIDVTNYQYVDVAVPEPAVVVTRTQDAAGGTIVSINTTQLTAIEPLGVSVNGTYTPPQRTAYGPVVVNVPGGTNADDKQIQFIDYDGTVLYSYTATEFEELSTLPANPSHNGLTAQGWNWTIEEISAQIEEAPGMPITIGQMYTTSSGNTEIYVDLDEDTLNPYLQFAVNGSVSIDWGDGSQPEIVTGTSTNYTYMQLVGHTYASAGSYMISLAVTGSLCILSNSSYSPPYYSCFIRNNNNFDLEYAYCLKEIHIGNNVSLGGHAFSNCLALERISCPSSVTFQSNGGYHFHNCVLLKGFVFPRGITEVKTSCFYQCHNLVHISLPRSLTTISMEAFSWDIRLRGICIPGNVTTIATNAFYYCQECKNVVIPSGVKSVSQGAFAYACCLETATLPSGLTSLGRSAFEGCRMLRSISVPSRVGVIGAYTFNSCYTLSSVTIPDNVNLIESFAFSGCRNLRNITLPAQLVSIYPSAFQGCITLSSISIPSGTISVGSYAFEFCSRLTNVTLPSSLSFLGAGVFSGCSALQSISLPGSLPVIPSNAFNNCFVLKSVSIPDGVSIIWSAAFYCCSQLSNVTVPSTVTSFSPSAFYSCPKLESITIPNGVTIIPSHCFAYCSALTSMTIPSTVTAIHSYAFSYCTGISEYHVLPTNPPTLSNNVFNNIAGGCIIYVPSSALVSYQTAWPSVSSRMQGE